MTVLTVALPAPVHKMLMCCDLQLIEMRLRMSVSSAWCFGTGVTADFCCVLLVAWVLFLGACVCLDGTDI